MTSVAQTMNWYTDFLPKFTNPNEIDIDTSKEFWLYPEDYEDCGFDMPKMIKKFKRHFKGCEYMCVNRITKNFCVKFVIYQKGTTDAGLVFEVLQDLMDNGCRITKLNTLNQTLNFVVQKDNDHTTNITDDAITTIF